MFRHVFGEKKMRRGNISSLPKSIRNESMILEKTLITSKFNTGPTAPSPGPTFPMQVKTAENVVIKSKLSNEIRSVPPIMQNTHAARKRIILCVTPVFTGVSSTRITLTLRG